MPKLIVKGAAVNIAISHSLFDSWVGKIRWRRDRLPTPVFLGFPGGSAGKELPEMWETWVQSLGWEDPLEKERLPTPVFWPREFHGLNGPWGFKELDTTEQLSLNTSAF